MFGDGLLDLELLERSIRENLDTGVEAVTEIFFHLLEGGGKRVRPALSIISYKICNPDGDEAKVMNLAVSIEYIHSATLFHDDVVDEAEVRRGRKSANSIWGNELTVLVGDFLFAKSFHLLVHSGSMELLELLAKTTCELAEGEISELVKTGDLGLTEDEYMKIIKNKTAVLMGAACRGGAILADAPPEEKDALYDFGINFGLSFQIMDDCLDYAGDEKTFGKEIGKDLEEGKVTLPLIHLLSVCSPNERKKVKDAFFEGARSYKLIYDLMLSHGSIDYAVKKARELAQRAVESLDIFPDSPYKRVLLELAESNMKRRV